jgi:hypothetical protein
MRGPKRYFGYRDAGDIATVVYLTYGGTWAPLKLDPKLRKRGELKSPNGWEWGYGGSGPSELARHLLAHATGQPRYLNRPDLYQKFKAAVVARFDRESWTLDAQRIRAWVRQVEAANPAGADTAWATAESPLPRRDDDPIALADYLAHDDGPPEDDDAD